MGSDQPRAVAGLILLARGARTRIRLESGQVLVVFALALPVLLGFAAITVDFGNFYVQKRGLQKAADAAALAGASKLPCPDFSYAVVTLPPGDPVRRCWEAAADRASDYNSANGGPTLVLCADSAATNCAEGDAVLTRTKLRVRSKITVSTFFGGIFGQKFVHVGAKAAAVQKAIFTQHCDFSSYPPAQRPPQPWDQHLPDCVIPPGPSSTITGIPQAAVADTCDFSTVPIAQQPPQPWSQYLPSCVTPPIGGVDGATALILSRSCSAFGYTGAGGGSMGSFVTNGGLSVLGSDPKRIERLGYDGACGKPTAQSDTAACTLPPPGGFPKNSAADKFSCVLALTDVSLQTPFPISWPITPPTLPTPVTAAWNAATDYPTKCHDVGSTDTLGAVWAAANPPGIYCYSVANSTLNLQNDLTGGSSGDGYTFFALNGSKIQLASNTSSFKFYWPSACGPRPTSRPATFTCFGQTIPSGLGGQACATLCYDPQTLFYSTSTAKDSGTCSNNAICLNGQNNSIVGDIFAPLPNTFPPPVRTNPAVTTTGAGVFIAGGGNSAGSGFIETWWLNIQGNFGSYTGTGMNVGGHSVIGTFVAGTGPHCDFSGVTPPPAQPWDQYLPTSCIINIPGSPQINGTITQTQIGADFNMDE